MPRLSATARIVPPVDAGGKPPKAGKDDRLRAQAGRKRHYAVGVGLVFSAVFVALSLRHVDVHQVWQALYSSHWWPWYLLAPLIYCLGHVVRGVRCRIILRPHCTISTMTATNIVVIGYAANNVLPARMGEVVRAYVLSRRAKLSVSLSLAVTFLERVMDGLSITLLLLVAGTFTPLPGWGRRLLWLGGALFLAALAGIVLTMRARAFVLASSRRLMTPLPARLRERLISSIERGISATDCLRDSTLAAKIAALSLGVWVVEGCMFLVILPAFGLPANPIWAWMALAVTNLGILFPSSPGYIGPFHYFCMRALMLFGVSSETALGYAIMAHLLYYVPITIWGLSALAVYGIDLGAAVRETREQVADREPGAFPTEKVDLVG